MRHLNMLTRLVLMMTCFIFGYSSHAESPTDRNGLTSERTGVFETPPLVAPTEGSPTELRKPAEMRDAANFYTALMWAVYTGTGAPNIRESEAAYTTLIEKFGAVSVQTEIGKPTEIGGESFFVSRHDLSFIYTERARLRAEILQYPKGAEADVRRAIALNPENVAATWLLSRILEPHVTVSLREKRRDGRAQAVQTEMLSLLKRVLELDPDHADAHGVLGALARELGHIELAITSFKALTRIMPFAYQYHIELGELYEIQNRLDAAVLSYERVVTILPEAVWARNRLGHLYLQTGDAPAAIEAFLAVLTQLQAQAGTSGGSPNWRAAGEGRRTEVEAHHGISLAYQAQDNFERAEFHITRALGLLEKRATSMRDGSRRVGSADRIAVTRALQRMRYTQGQIYLRFNAPQKAVHAFARVLQTDANDVPALSGIGMAYQGLDDLKRAELHFRKAIELASTGEGARELPDVYNALGYLYAEQGIRLEEAAALVRRALKSSPTSGAYLDSLGLIYLKQGKLDAAIESLELALGYLPDTPEILLHLADAYLQKGLVERALQILERALRLDPDNGELRRKRDAVKAGSQSVR